MHSVKTEASIENMQTAYVCMCGPKRIAVHQQLHDLSQPLTALLCQLELASMLGTQEALRDAVSAGLVEATRIVKYVQAIRANIAEERTAELHGEVGQ